MLDSLVKALVLGLGFEIATWLPAGVVLLVTLHVLAECGLSSTRGLAPRVPAIVIVSSWLSLCLGTSFGIMSSYALGMFSRDLLGMLLTVVCILLGILLRGVGLWLIRGARLGVAVGIASSFLVSVAAIAWLLIFLPSWSPSLWQQVSDSRTVTRVDYAAVFTFLG